jgi:hypothetical protein
MYKHIDMALHYRKRAGELLTDAGDTTNEKDRQLWTELAHDYEEMAVGREAIALTITNRAALDSISQKRLTRRVA